MPVDPASTTNVWQAFPDPDQFAAFLNKEEGGRTNKFVIANNNPGNLKDSSGNFVKFGSWEEGRQALLNRMRDWQRRFPDMTIAQFNRRYAPDKSHGGDNPDGTEAGRNQRMLSAMSGGTPTRTAPATGVTNTTAPGGPTSGPMTVSDFAARIRTAIPQLSDTNSYPDEVLVGAALRARPDLITRMTASPTQFPQPTPSPLTVPERAGLAGGTALGNVLLGATKRSAREALTSGPQQGQGTIPGIWGSRPFTPTQLSPKEDYWWQHIPGFSQPSPQEEAGAQQFDTPFQQTVRRGVQQAITPTGTAQKMGSYIPDVVAGGQVLRELPALTRDAWQVAQGIRLNRMNPLVWPSTIFRNIPETVAPEAFRRHVQEVAGAGREAVAEDIRAAQDANLEALGKHKEAVANAEREHQNAIREYLNKKATGQQADAEKLRRTRKAWVDRSAEYRSAQRQAETIRNQQESLIRGRNELADRARQNLTDTYKITESRFNSRYFHLKRAIEQKLPGEKGGLNPYVVQRAIDEAKDKFLVGSPENLKVFNDLTRWMTEEGPTKLIDTEAGGRPYLRNIPWDEGRVHHSAMGDDIRPGNTLAGNVVQAIRYVRQYGTGAELMRVAEAAGEGKTYAALSRDYREFKTDWSDPGSVALGGSPLRPALARQDNPQLIGDVTGDAGDRLLRTLAKYKNHGANMRLFEDMRSLTNRLEALPKVRIPSAPGPFEPPAPSEPPTAPEFPEVKRPNVRIPRPEDIRRGRLRQYAGRPVIPRELGLFQGIRSRIPFTSPYMYRIYRQLLKDPEFLERVARTPRQEIQP